MILKFRPVACLIKAGKKAIVSQFVYTASAFSLVQAHPETAPIPQPVSAEGPRCLPILNANGLSCFLAAAFQPNLPIGPVLQHE